MAGQGDGPHDEVFKKADPPSFGGGHNPEGADERRSGTAPIGFVPERDKGKEPHHCVEPHPSQKSQSSGKRKAGFAIAPAANPTPKCFRCGRYHSGLCKMGRVCYTCRQPGHTSYDCPNKETFENEEADAVRTRPDTGKQPMGRGGHLPPGGM